MTSKESFSPEEWASLVMAGTWVGHAIIIADRPRRVRKELKALRNAFDLAARNYPGNGLIGAVLPEAKAAALVEFDAKAMFAKKEENMQRIMTDLHGTSMALKKVEGKEGMDFRRWLLNIGELTALAVRDEEFAMIGMPGDEISRLERRVLRNVASELGLIPYTVNIEPVKK
jgi:hypothetical protein